VWRVVSLAYHLQRSFTANYIGSNMHKQPHP